MNRFQDTYINYWRIYLYLDPGGVRNSKLKESGWWEGIGSKEVGGGEGNDFEKAEGLEGTGSMKPLWWEGTGPMLDSIVEQFNRSILIW